MSSTKLSSQQAHALLDILTHHEVYQEIRDFRAPGTLSTYGPPFNDTTPSTSPSLQALISKFVTNLPGLQNVAPDFWQKQCESIVQNFEVAELSESYDKGHVGIRKTLATAVSALIEYPVRGVFAGFDEPKPEDRDRKYDLASAEDLQLACRDFLHEIVYDDLLDSIFEKAATTDKLGDHRPIVQAAHEYGLVNLASFLHYTLIISPKGQHLLTMIEHANKLIPYTIIRQTLKIGNVASMMNAMMKVVLAKVSMASVTNWVGWTKDADEGMNLLETIISTVLQIDTKEFKSKAHKIEKEKHGPSKEHLSAIRAYVDMSREEHEQIREKSETMNKSIVAVIFEDASVSGTLTNDQHRQALDYLSMQLSIRDREKIVQVLCHSHPDHLTQLVRDLVSAYEPVIRHVHEAVNLSDTVLDFEYFMKDMIKLSKMPTAEETSHGHGFHKHRHSVESNKPRQPPTVGDFVQLLERHQYSSHRFLHQCAKNGKEVTKWFYDYAREATSHFRKPDKEEGIAKGVPAPSMSSSSADAGVLAAPLRKLFSELPEQTRKEIVPILDAYSEHIVALHESSSARLHAVLASPRSNHPIFLAPSHHSISRPSSRMGSRAASPEPSHRSESSAQSSPALGPVHVDDPKHPTVDPGPGAYLARWQALLDATPITPSAPEGALRKGLNPSVLDASRHESTAKSRSVDHLSVGSSSNLSQISTGQSSISSTTSLVSQNTEKGPPAKTTNNDNNGDEDDDDEFHDAVEKVMEVQVPGSERVVKISRPNISPVVKALEPQFRELLGKIAATR